MSLTYPEERAFDSSIPSENWFFYWKTSPTLWEAKLNYFPDNFPIFIPVFWGLHAQANGSYEFTDHTPETNLLKLSQLAKSLNKNLVFLVPLGPMPFLVNGGLPSFLARKLAHFENGLVMSVINFERKINKIYSYLERDVLLEYQRFTRSFGEFLKHHELNSDVYGFESGKILSNGLFKSYLEDYSPSFVKYYNFYKQKNAEVKTTENEFRNMINNMYVATARDNIAKNWVGELKVSFLGGSVEDLFLRSEDNEDIENYFTELFDSYTNLVIPSSLLLPPSDTKKVVDRCINEMTNRRYLMECMHKASYQEENFELTPLNFFNVIHDNSNGFLEQSGLMAYLESNFKWCYNFTNINMLENQNDFHERITLINGQAIDATNFTKLINYFLAGNKIILDTQYLDENLLKKLEYFALENNLETQNILLHTKLTYYKLQAGEIILYNSESLKAKNHSTQNEFWKKMINYFDLHHLDIQEDNKNPLVYFWRRRDVTNRELNFQEIRRVSIFNNSHVKKSCVLNFPDNFAVQKILDETGVKLQHEGKNMKIEFKPYAKVAIEFGFYNERN
ncbi:MAG: hypothetical protein JNM93_07880 [Bacteriovoracaceae bacterium]|nr:hypothetical protein [Bacteriovoracaceae bacterium]